jgi:hypothetical protein
MKLKTLISSFNKETAQSIWMSLEEVTRAVGLGFAGLYGEAEFLKGYHTEVSWICTDSRVGISLVFMGNELVMVGYQYGRKSDVDYRFVSEKAFDKVRNECLKLLAAQNDEDLTIVDMEEDITEWVEKKKETDEWNQKEFKRMKAWRESQKNRNPYLNP